MAWYAFVMPASARMAVVFTLAIACVDLSRPPELEVGELPVEPAATGGRTMMSADVHPASGGVGGSAPDGDAASPFSDADATSAEVTPAETPDLAAPADADAALLVPGQGCTRGDQCKSAFCVDGVCCDGACTGLCEACNQTALLGTCAPIPAGQDPGDECAMDPVSSCGRDGTCNGARQCRRYVAGTECAAPGCQGSVEHAAGQCDKDGVCQPGTSRSCAPNLCKGDSCGAVCASPADCQNGYFCNGGTCAVKRPAAAACTTGIQCATGFCADGVCCGSACSETCSSCNLAGSAGTCAAAPVGMDPRAECPAQPASSCGRAGGCDGSRRCRLYPNTTTCSAASCTAGTALPAATCNGAGSCQMPAAVSCGGYGCNGTLCGTTCSGDAQCASGYGCTGSSCVLLKIASLTVNDTANASSWSVQRNFQIGTSGAHPWVDFPNSYISALDPAAARLLGDEWVRLAAASKLYTGGPQASITLAAAADVYIVVDDRWGAAPSFTAGWTDTGWNLTIWETATRSFPFSIFKKAAQTGTVTFPPIGSNMAYDFFIIVD
jgi:hypothetical protein